MLIPESNHNPYYFSLKASVPEGSIIPFEEEVRREQQRTIFDADPELRRLFRDDFELYHHAMEHPEYFFKTAQSLKGGHREGEGPRSSFDLHRHWEEGASHEGEDDAEGLLQAFTDEWEEKELDDPLVREADAWADALHRWSHTLYFNRKIKNKDLFRVHENSFVISDLAYECAEVTAEEGGVMTIATAEQSVAMLRIALVFLGRCIDSLTALKIGKIGASATVERNIALSMKLLEALKAAVMVREIFLSASGRWEYIKKLN